jgi:serine/threonine protein kinase
MTASISQEDLRQMAARWLPLSQGSHRFQIHKDTTDFFRVDYGDVVVLGGRPYLIRHNAKEGRFGVDDEVKFWVKRAIDLESGSLKIIKLVFYESFKARIGGIEFECFRSPKKEARILDRVAGHNNFMHGYSVEDEEGNLIRVLDYIFGKSLHAYIESLQMDHKSYFYNLFPGILGNFIECIEAIRFLHQLGEKHGDIRRDHVLIDRNNGRYRWIDFDFNYRHRENIYGYDLFGLGNILVFLVGMGDVLLLELQKQNHPALGTLWKEDVNIVFKNRISNLKKIYPYIPESLNRVLMHFSEGANWFYENTEQLLDDLKEFQTLTCTSP